VSRARAPLIAPPIKADRSVEPPDLEQSNQQQRVDDVEANYLQVQRTILGSGNPPHSAHRIITTIPRSADGINDQEGDRNRKNKVIIIVSPKTNSIYIIGYTDYWESKHCELQIYDIVHV